MLQLEKNSVSEGNGIDKINASKECMFFHYCHLTDVRFIFEPNVCNKCHDV